MAKPLTSFSIRVNIPEEKEYVVKEEVVILWGRIWSAGIAVLLIIGVSVSLLLNISGGGHTEDIQRVKSAQLLVADKAMVDVVAVAAAKVEAISPSTAKANALSAVRLSPESSDTKVLAPVIASELVPRVVIEPEVKVVAREVLTPSDLVPATVTASSDHLLRAALTTEMKRRQPANEAAAVLLVPDGELLTVYFFTELKGLRKQTVHYDWFRNDKRVARVKIRPRFDTTGNFSSKYIDRNMRGQWRVTAKTASGEQIAMAQFEVR